MKKIVKRIQTKVLFPIITRSFFKYSSFKTYLTNQYISPQTSKVRFYSEISNPKVNIIQDYQCKIHVMGIGGAGCNAVDNMVSYSNHIQNINFVVCNTDVQSLEKSKSPKKIQIGKKITNGMGSGSQPLVGTKSAQEDLNEVMNSLEGSDLLFLTCGLGGGTGTGATPIIALEARKRGILTVGVVCTPFSFEGEKKKKLAQEGMTELEKNVDTLIIINNDVLFNVSKENTKMTEAFLMVDDVLRKGVDAIIELICSPGLINLDFADVQATMKSAGRAYIGAGQSSEEIKDGKSKGKQAIETALNNPMLEVDNIEEATNVLLHIHGNVTLQDVEDIANNVKEKVNDNTNIIVGVSNDETIKTVRVSLVISGIPNKPKENSETIKKKKEKMNLNGIFEFFKKYW